MNAAKKLDEAREAARGSKSQMAWKHLNRARRLIYESYEPEEIAARTKVLRLEATEKLKNWRKDAVMETLPADNDGPPPTLGALVLAQFLLDEHFENLYFKLELLGARTRTMSIIFLLLVAALLVSAFLLGRTDAETESIFFSIRDLSFIMLLGATGAGISILLSLNRSAGRIPEALRGWLATLMRPMLGALSAVAVIALIQAGLLPIEMQTDEAIWVYALLAGFSDQFAVRALDAAEKAATG